MNLRKLGGDFNRHGRLFNYQSLIIYKLILNDNDDDCWPSG